MALQKAIRRIRLQRGVCSIRRHSCHTRKVTFVSLGLSVPDYEQTFSNPQWMEVYQDTDDPSVIALRRASSPSGNVRVMVAKNARRIVLPRSVEIPREFIGGRFQMVHSLVHRMWTINLREPIE